MFYPFVQLLGLGLSAETRASKCYKRKRRNLSGGSPTIMGHHIRDHARTGGGGERSHFGTLVKSEFGALVSALGTNPQLFYVGPISKFGLFGCLVRDLGTSSRFG